MSLITCCPACATMFKVVPDQLKISDGWVRCGHCAEVFDATVHMQGQNQDLAGQNPPDLEGQAQAGPPPPVESVPQAEPALHLPDSEPTQAEDYLSYPAFELPRSEYEDFAPMPGPDDSFDPIEPSALLSRPGDSEFETAVADVSFVRQARRKAFWRSGGMRVTLVVLALALAALLVLQFGVQERDRIAATQPALRPLLEALCQPLSCQVGPPRQIEAIVIDSSTFNKLRGDAYRLAFTLKNQASIAVAMPAVELTLSDSQDQTLLRRVLTPAELDSAGGVIGASSDWSGTVAFGLAPGSPAGRVAGPVVCTLARCT